MTKGGSILTVFLKLDLSKKKQYLQKKTDQNCLIQQSNLCMFLVIVE